MVKTNLTKLHKCDQLWEEMTPAEQGRICQKCKHTIIDFRGLSNKEVTEIHAFTEGRVCGIYRKDQLESPLETRRQAASLKSFFVGVVGFLSSINGVSQSSTTSENIVQTEPNFDENRQAAIQQLGNIAKTVRDSFIIRGKLIGTAGEPIIGANIHVKNTRIYTVSDVDGEYLLNITSAFDSTEQITVVYQSVGYSSQDSILTKSQFLSSPEQIINVHFNDQLVMEEFYVRSKLPLHRRIWNGIRRLFSSNN